MLFELVLFLTEQHQPPDATDLVCALSSGRGKRRSQLGRWGRVLSVVGGSVAPLASRWLCWVQNG